ncbi:MAG: hypothetical protein AAF196_18225 [Planctomycetota bacterium]
MTNAAPAPRRPGGVIRISWALLRGLILGAIAWVIWLLWPLV